ncbi:Na+/H+ antiporter NhaA [Elizabethkingia anophelis]|uniref:Na+/H+ antiporter NhaA n=1 Tax=Elizabethkingia anophelis TaxID=1117645 RepID=UPI0011EA851C|nr:Na+/H+ antiporter NhaA [Elizabethkingia anophelis]TYT30773.1 Na+/H+ antiporter NhaA [Elizabethkingia anophelis]
MYEVNSIILKIFESSQSSGIILILCVLVSLFIANSSLGTGFQNILDSHLGPYSVAEWINDGLMSVFFLLVGLEIKREMLEGELSNIKNASLPIFAAIGGMLVPALIYAFFNNGTEYAKGWGIPMATDIAFSLAIISMLSSRVPASIKIFLAALAIVDDLGAILVIAIFYTEQLHWSYLLISGGILVLLVLFNKLGIKKHIFYLIPGVALWYCMHHSGIHATIAGVLLAFTIPTNISDTEISPLEKLEGMLHTPVNYLIMPIFALANTNIVFQKGMVDGLFTSFGAGIIGGLIIGKLVGILLFSFIAVKLGISKLPQHSKWSQMVGVGLLAAIGFTMSIFIAILSFKGHQDIQDEAKFAILVASTLAGFAGYTVLKFTSKRRRRIN